jgi:hypothetical protein
LKRPSTNCFGLSEARCPAAAIVTATYEVAGSVFHSLLCGDDAARLYRGGAFGPHTPYRIVGVTRTDDTPVDPSRLYYTTDVVCSLCGKSDRPDAARDARCICPDDEATDSPIIVVDAVGGVLLAQEEPHRHEGEPFFTAFHFPTGCDWMTWHTELEAALADAIEHSETCTHPIGVPLHNGLGWFVAPFDHVSRS